jgi:hypothetical protein
MKVLTHYANKAGSAPIDIKVSVIPDGRTYVITGMSFSCSATQFNLCRIRFNGVIIDEAQSDKFINFPAGVAVEGNGIRSLDLELDNSNEPAGARLGISIYYEEVG